MAEGLTNRYFSDTITAFSAGTNPGQVHPMAIKVMAEKGIDISGNRSKHLNEFKEQDMDLVITVCDGANEICPFFPGAKDQEHAGFPDPAAVEGPENERMDAFRRVRDEISDFILTRFAGI
ncbi:MAG: arsenate reductase ArsC [Methanomassiliicoccales archaeon]|jgi:arsenate reductase|nr:arsenate reductase ArsC [Methanomassiliicoccales archaeon]